MVSRELTFPVEKTTGQTAFERRFWAKVDKVNGPVHLVHGRCWTWTAGKDQGYGVFRVGPCLLEKAHRVAWEFVHGAAGDLFVCHHCDNRACVRDEHLFLGTTQDNIDDCRSKGRHPTWRLSDGDVAVIRERQAAGESYGAIARDLGVSRATVWKVFRGRSFAIKSADWAVNP